MSRSKKITLFSSIFFLIFGVIIFIAGKTLPVKDVPGQVGPEVFPQVIGVVIAILSFALILMALSEIKQDQALGIQEEIKKDSLFDLKSVLLTMALLVIYVFLIPSLGFVIAGILYLFLQMIVMSNKPTPKQFVLYAVISIILPFVVYSIFVNVFNLMLPAGLLDGII